MKKLVVVNHPSDWHARVSGVDVVSVRSYLTDPSYHDMRNVRVFNLSRNYWYQSSGYYVSLLAEARGHKVIPSVTTIQDLKSASIVRTMSEDLDAMIQHKLSRLKSNKFELSIYFGKNLSPRYDELSHKLYGLFQAPLMRAHFVFQRKWILQSLTPISAKDIPESHLVFVQKAAEAYFGRRHYERARAKKSPYDLAILVNDDDPTSPSNKPALQRFATAGERAGFDVDFITKADYDRLPEYDALFIRETTAVGHHTYRFARTAWKEDIPCLDDHLSIMRCANKVYLAETLERGHLPIPKTLIVHKENRDAVAECFGSFPIVLKQPDSSSSKGVKKVADETELKAELDRLLSDSDLVIAQEFIPTPFDWRIGVLEGRALYACKYFMAPGHWQVLNWKKSGQAGTVETIAIEDAPKAIVEAAVKAASLIGSGFYGVDLKERDGRVYVIEVNDNPNVDAGVEDRVIGTRLYDDIIGYLRRGVDAVYQTTPL